MSSEQPIERDDAAIIPNETQPTLATLASEMPPPKHTDAPTEGKTSAFAEKSNESSPKQTEEQAEGEQPQQRKKKEKQPKPPAAPPVPARPLSDPTRWRMVVGCVERVWEHEASDKLWCEEINIGGGEVHQIGSGLRQFVKKEEFEGAKVIVLANLKEKKLGGFPSHGMVICASSESHDQVELLIPPPEAEVGDLVTFEGLEGEPDAVLTAKKNGDTIAGVMDTLKTDADCNAVAGDRKFLVRGQPVRAKTLANAHVG